VHTDGLIVPVFGYFGHLGTLIALRNKLEGLYRHRAVLHLLGVLSEILENESA
jgi:hypothetical protein